MGKIIIFLCVAVIIFGISGRAESSLVDQPDGTVYDDVGDLYWYKDLSAFTNMTYAEQLSSIDAIPGTNFHLASSSEMGALWAYSASEIGNAFTRSGQHTSDNNTEYDDWYGRYDATGPTANHHYIAQAWHDTTHDTWDRNPLPGFEHADSVRDWTGAWVASDTALVPIPAALWLLGSGLIGLLALRRRTNKKC